MDALAAAHPHSWHAFYMTGGTVIPMTASVRISSRRTTATVANRKMFPLLVGFAEDGMTMVEGVEKLRQLEDVLGQIGRLSRGNALVDHVGSLGGREPEFPDLVVRLGRQVRCKIGQLKDSRSLR